MKTFLTLPALVAALILGFVVTWPFQPDASRPGRDYVFEIDVESSEAGFAQLYYDRGNGVNEADSVRLAVPAGRPARLQFGIPSGVYRTLRLDPLDRPGRLALSDARIVDGGGREFTRIRAERFVAGQQIASLTLEGGRAITQTTPSADDPVVSLTQTEPIVLPIPPLAGGWRWVFASAGVFAGLAVLLAAAGALGPERRARVAARVGRWWERGERSPWRVLVPIAALSVAASAYPVIFLGKSFVSPNAEVVLLYQGLPTVPGATETEPVTLKRADVGAVMWQHLPFSIAQHRALFEDFEWPLWNRYNSSGNTMLGQGQSSFGDPLHFIPVLAKGAAWSWDVKFLLARLLFALGLGLVVWETCRHLPAAAAIAFSAPFIGAFVYRYNHPALFSLNYAPWILYCWLRALRATSLRELVAAAGALILANLAEMTSGTAKEAYMLLVTMNVTGVVWLFCVRQSWTHRLLRGAILMSAGLVFALITSPIWLTFADTLRTAYTSYNQPAAFQVPPGLFAGLFDEIFYRPYQESGFVINPSANLFILLGVLWALLHGRSLRGDRLALGLALASLLPATLVFGIIPAAWIVQVPVLGNVLHVDNTFSCGLIVLLAIAAGYGWREAATSAATPAGGRRALVVWIAFVAVIALWLGTTQATLRSAYAPHSWGALLEIPPFVQGYAWTVMAAAALVLGALVAVRRTSAANPGRTIAFVILGVVGVAGLLARFGLHAGSRFTDYVVNPGERADLARPSPLFSRLPPPANGPYRIVGFEGNLLPGWSGVYGLESISGPDALVNPYYRALLDAYPMERVWDWRYVVTRQTLPHLQRLLDLLNVRYYLDYRGDRAAVSAVLKPVAAADMELYESPTAWPRAFYTDRVAVYETLPQLLDWLRHGDGRAFATMQADDWRTLSPAPKVSGDLRDRRVVTASAYRLGQNRTQFAIDAPGPGMIVLQETYSPENFRVTVNGRQVPYLRVNHAFKGVWVDRAGHHEVSFSYWPRRFSLTLRLAGLGVGLAVLAALAAWRFPTLLRFSRP